MWNEIGGNDAPPQISEWWRTFGFDDYPFPQATAEAEKRLLRLWLSPSNFHAFFSGAASEQSAVIAAPRGVGKSAVKKYLYEQFVANNFAPPVLVVPVAYFGDFLDDSGKIFNATEGAHCRKLLAHFAWEICRIVQHRESDNNNPLGSTELKTLCDIVATLGPASDREHESAASHVLKVHGGFLRYWYFQNQSSSTRTWLARIGSGLLQRYGLPKELLLTTERTPQLAKLRDLWNTVGPTLGFQRILFLVNRLDEPGGKRLEDRNYDVKTTTEIADPLMSLLHDGGAVDSIAPGAVSVKVLIWDAAAERMNLRIGKFKYGFIYWTDEQIVELLRRRLEAYSGNHISDIRTIVHDEIATEVLPMLIRYSQRIPRLLKLHCRRGFRSAHGATEVSSP